MGCFQSTQQRAGPVDPTFIFAYEQHYNKLVLRKVDDPIRVFVSNTNTRYVNGLNTLQQLLCVDMADILKWLNALMKSALAPKQFVMFNPFSENIFDMGDERFDSVAYFLCGDAAQGVWTSACSVIAEVLRAVLVHVKKHQQIPKIRSIADLLKLIENASKYGPKRGSKTI